MALTCCQEPSTHMWYSFLYPVGENRRFGQLGHVRGHGNLLLPSEHRRSACCTWPLQIDELMVGHSEYQLVRARHKVWFLVNHRIRNPGPIHVHGHADCCVPLARLLEQPG